jgi:hypothetical protein
MQDVAIELDNEPGALARMGEALGQAGVSVEGGGAWVVDVPPGLRPGSPNRVLPPVGRGVAHFLFEDGEAARTALESVGITVRAVNDVLVQRLRQDVPGQLGKIARRMADAGVNIQVMYSDHDHRLILVVDDYATGKIVSEAWEKERAAAAQLTTAEGI